jgi:hypothetical protein
MARHHGGDKVNAGFYLNVATWEVTTLSGKGGTLPGGKDAHFLRVPTIGALMFAPLMGAVYAIFLPFIGIALVAQYATKKAAAGVRNVTESVMGTMTPAWRPGEAHFTGTPEEKDKAKEGERAPHVEERLKKIEKEIERRERKRK